MVNWIEREQDDNTWLDNERKEREREKDWNEQWIYIIHILHPLKSIRFRW